MVRHQTGPERQPKLTKSQTPAMIEADEEPKKFNIGKEASVARTSRKVENYARCAAASEAMSMTSTSVLQACRVKLQFLMIRQQHTESAKREGSCQSNDIEITRPPWLQTNVAQAKSSESPEKYDSKKQSRLGNNADVKRQAHAPKETEHHEQKVTTTSTTSKHVTRHAQMDTSGVRNFKRITV